MDVQHRSDEQRFTIDLADGEAFLAYELPREGVIDLQHTIVPESAQGQGLGGRLVEAAMAHARDAGLRVMPTCPFVQKWVDEHPESAVLLEGAGKG